MEKVISGFMDLVKVRNQHEPEFLQAVQEVAETVIPYIMQNDIYYGKNILLRIHALRSHLYRRLKYATIIPI